jgi:hypothetical protein
MMLREKNQMVDDIFKNTISDEFKSLLGEFKHDLILNSDDNEKLQDIHNNHLSFERGKGKDNRIKMVIFYSIEMFKKLSFNIPQVKTVANAIFTHVYKDIIDNYPPENPRSAGNKPPSKQYGYPESLKSAYVLCAGVS